MNKKAIAILGAIFILIVGTLGFLIIQRRNANPDSQNGQVVDNNPTPDPFPTPTPDPLPTPDPFPTPTPDPLPTPDPSPDQFGPSPVKLSSEQMVSPVIFYQGNGVAYFTPDGRLFQAAFVQNSGKLETSDLRELALPAKGGITKVHWPLNGNNFLVELGTTWPKRYAIYSSSKGDYVDLPKEAISADWMPDGEQVLYFWVEGDGKASLNVSPADFSTWDVIVDIWEPDNTMAVAPDGKTLLFWQSRNNAESNSINMVTTDGKLFRSVIKDGFNTNAVWAPDSRTFAFNRRTTNGEELWIGNMLTGQGVSTGLVTNTEKIVWSLDGRTVYAAVRSEGGFDELYRIDVASGQSTLVPILGGMGSARDLFFSLDGSRLFYYNTQDLGLFYVDLPSQ